MDSLRTKAKELLSSKAADVVIGYEEGSAGAVRPAFITNPENCGKLIYDERCVHNLAVYLTKKEVRKLGTMAIVAALPAMRSIMTLLSEKQITPEKIIGLGRSADNEFIDIADIEEMKAYIDNCELGIPEKVKTLISDIQKLTPHERFAYWTKELSKCMKCYACRQACPMCYCIRCTVEVNQPQWIPVQANTHGNMEWHILRAMHLAGRCVNCGECGRVCPVGIPCHLLTMFIAEQVYDNFNVYAGTSDNMKSVLSTYEPNDKESFII
jgi:ferredoxin